MVRTLIFNVALDVDTDHEDVRHAVYPLNKGIRKAIDRAIHYGLIDDEDTSVERVFYVTYYGEE